MGDQQIISVNEIAAHLDKLLDDEAAGNYSYFLPISVVVNTCWSSPEHSAAAGVSICRQIFKRLIKGDTQESIEKYLCDTLEYDHPGCIQTVFILTLECAKCAAYILRGKATFDEALKRLPRFRNIDPKMIHGILAMMLALHRDRQDEFPIERIGNIWRTPQSSAPPRGCNHIAAAAIAAWPLLCLGLGFRWWSSLLLSIFSFIMYLVIVMCFSARRQFQARKRGRVFTGWHTQ